jgi:hypothetical protein
VHIIRRHVGTVGLQEETLERGVFDDLGGVGVGGVGDDAGDADEGVGEVGEDGGGEGRGVGKTVDVEVGFAGDMLFEDAEDVVVRFSCVDYNRIRSKWKRG